MKLLFTIILIISYYCSFVLSATSKPLIEITEGLMYQDDNLGLKYYRADIINNSPLSFNNVTINCVDCFGNSDQFRISYSSLYKNIDGTYTLPSLRGKNHETFAYNGPQSAKWYVVSSK